MSNFGQSNFGQAVLLTALSVLGLIILSFFPDWVTDMLLGLVGIVFIIIIVGFIIIPLLKGDR